eukprot:6134500-Amphidinium_carterae.1
MTVVQQSLLALMDETPPAWEVKRIVNICANTEQVSPCIQQPPPPGSHQKAEGMLITRTHRTPQQEIIGTPKNG